MSLKREQFLAILALVVVGAALGGLLPSVVEAVGSNAANDQGGEDPVRLTKLTTFAEKNAGEHFLVIEKHGRDAVFHLVTGEQLAQMDMAAETVSFVVPYRATLFCKGWNCLPCRLAECPIPPPPLPFFRLEAQIGAGWRMGEVPKELAAMH